MHTYSNGGLTFNYLDEGTGEPVVLLHGFPEDAASWDNVAPLLHAAGFRTLAPHQRGYSPGAVPKRRRDYRIELLSADVLALLDATNVERAHIVGHDWGGVVAWDLAMRHPDRVASLVAPTSGAATTPSSAPRRPRRPLISSQVITGSSNWTPPIGCRRTRPRR